jgi:hypothetical protein
MWRRTALAVDVNPAAARQEFRRDLLGLAACAVSVYGWLIGLGRLLLSSDPAWPSLVLVAIAFAAVPVWSRSLRTG